MNSLYKKVLKKITPPAKEIRAEKKLVEEIRHKLAKVKGKHSHLEWCGSSARGTHLKGDKDLDLFIMFEKELPAEQLEQEGIRVAKAIFRGHKWEKAYSQHPYLRGEINGFEVELVPSYIVPSGKEKQSAVDRTPFHNKYLLKKFSEKQKQDARLLKQFLKGINAYGADLKNCALPGYGVELLLVYYGSFDKAIKGIAGWTEKETILLEKRERNPREDFFTPLIIIDPVDENRNVASALSEKQYEKMKLAAQKFLETPSEKFFFGASITIWPKQKIIEELNKREFMAIQAEFPKKILSDLVWGQLRRYLRKAANQLEEKDFIVKKTDLWSDEDKVFFLYELKELNLSKTKKVFGPPVSDKENVKKFLEKKRKIISGPREENGRILLEVEREETNAKQVLQEYVNECKTQESDGIKICLRKAKVLTEKDLLEHYKGALAEHLTKYFEGKEAFE